MESAEKNERRLHTYTVECVNRSPDVEEGGGGNFCIHNRLYTRYMYDITSGQAFIST